METLDNISPNLEMIEFSGPTKTALIDNAKQQTYLEEKPLQKFD